MNCSFLGIGSDDNNSNNSKGFGSGGGQLTIRPVILQHHSKYVVDVRIVSVSALPSPPECGGGGGGDIDCDSDGITVATASHDKSVNIYKIRYYLITFITTSVNEKSYL